MTPVRDADRMPSSLLGAEGASSYVWTPPVITESQRAPLRRATVSSSAMPTPWLGGVCSGLSVHLGMPVTLVRIIMGGSTFFFGAGVLLYLWLWLMLPKDEENRNSIDSATGSPDSHRVNAVRRNQLLIAGLFLVFGAITAFVLAASGTVSFNGIFAASFVLIGLGLVWTQVAEPSNWRTLRFLVIVSAGVVLLLIGLVFLIGREEPPIVLLRDGLIGAVIGAAIIFALGPLWLRTSKDLSDTQAQQVRDAERADIAAHLHDSVLQTLTLIRASSNDPVRVRALALAEERELRSWLYTGREEAGESLAEVVRETVGSIESRYGVAVEVVAVSDTRPGPEELALVAALGEAVTNAVRHGAPPVSVYLEVRPDVIEAFVKDSGSGFDPDSIPSDRQGVRNSILGRMERVGGTAKIRCLASGTEVGLRLPRFHDDPKSSPPPPLITKEN